MILLNIVNNPLMEKHVIYVMIIIILMRMENVFHLTIVQNIQLIKMDLNVINVIKVIS